MNSITSEMLAMRARSITCDAELRRTGSWLIVGVVIVNKDYLYKLRPPLSFAYLEGISESRADTRIPQCLLQYRL